ncbi:tetratricopeptide repeat protein [Streptacidiphilus sp. 4-A2]|nr:tetratricopeptide repeat protein [Streptacidiphilus sp. 4-A2]
MLDLHRRVGNREKEANTMVSIGIVHLGAERYQEAIDWFKEAIPIVRSVSTPFALASVLNALGEAYSSAGSFDDAITSFQASLTAARVADSRFAEAATLDGLGVTYQRCGRTAEAIECLRQAVDIQQELAEGQGEGRSLDNLAASLLADCRPAEARSCWERALGIFTELSHPRPTRSPGACGSWRTRGAEAAPRFEPAHGLPLRRGCPLRGGPAKDLAGRRGLVLSCPVLSWAQTAAGPDPVRSGPAVVRWCLLSVEVAAAVEDEVDRAAAVVVDADLSVGVGG